MAPSNDDRREEEDHLRPKAEYEADARKEDDSDKEDGGRSLHSLLRPSTGLSDPVVIDWDAVLNRIATHPHEASHCETYGWQGSRRRNPLQLVLTSSVDWRGGASSGGGGASSSGEEGTVPGEVVRELIRAYPDAAFITDEMGYSPLYLACIHSAGVEAVRELLHAPVTVSRRRSSCSSISSRRRSSCSSFASSSASSATPSIEQDDDDDDADSNDSKEEEPLMDDSAFRRMWSRSQASAAERYYRKVPLHVSSNAEVTKLLLDAYPRGAFRESLLGQIPLHRAVNNSMADEEVVRALVRGGRAAAASSADADCQVNDNEQGQACVSPGDIREGAVLDECRRWNGGVLEGDSHGKTPFEYVCEKLVRHLPPEDASEHSGSGDGNDNGNGNGNTEQPQASLSEEAQLLWSKMTVMAEEISQSQIPATGEPMLLHSLLRLGAPAPIVRRALSHRRAEAEATGKDPLTEMDQNGMTPLSVACSNPRTLPDLFAILLHPVKGCPSAAATKDARGMFPLHHLARCGRGWAGYKSSADYPTNGKGEKTEDGDDWMANGVTGALLRAYPEALAEPDGGGMLPFMLAAMSRRSATAPAAAAPAASGEGTASDDGCDGIEESDSGDGVGLAVSARIERDDDREEDEQRKKKKIGAAFALLREDPSVILQL